MPRTRGCAGYSTGVSLIGVAVSLVIMAILLLIAVHPFGGTSGATGTASNSILSQSSAESQIKLCAEGRNSSYGDPPTPTQQAWCVQQLATQAGSVPQVP